MTQAAEDVVAAEWVTLRNATVGGRSADALALAESIIAAGGDQRRVCQAMIEKLAAMLNMGHDAADVTELIDTIHEALRLAPDPRLVGEFHAIAGAVMFEQGSLPTAMMHLVHAEQALRRMDETNLAAVDAWHDLSLAYSTCGFHAQSMVARQEAVDIGVRAGLAPQHIVMVEAQLRAALSLDQRGDSAGCASLLEKVRALATPIALQLEPAEWVFLRYASVRLGTLTKTALRPLPPAPTGDAMLAEVDLLTAVCEAISEGDGERALRLLNGPAGSAEVFGLAEPLRLRSLALSLGGDAGDAVAVERKIHRLLVSEERQLRDVLVDSVRTRLDQDRLRSVSIQFAGRAYTDPLTGLPNRRQTNDVAMSLIRRGTPAMIGVLDLDGFKAVNDTHGHPSGDLVLQRVAGIFARCLREGDLVARHGGDEFVILLTAANEADAETVTARIQSALRDEDWSALAPGTPVSVSFGWAPLIDGLDGSLRAADKALYAAKAGSV
ncbi:MAG TPA: GGDEF domain-containing protein [Micromonosporaceae bacterium]|jgi:diguanylate cyclase (GGDEF)-like protein